MSYDRLKERFRRIAHLDHAIAILDWDEAVMMPAAAGPERAEVLASLHGMRHQLLADPEIGDWLASVEGEARQQSPDVQDAANLREMKRAWQRVTCLPRDLVEASKRSTMTCEQAWRDLRAQNAWRELLPLQHEVVARQRDIADILGDALGVQPYDALLDRFEPGIGTGEIDRLFAPLRVFLPNFTAQVIERQRMESVIEPRGPFPVERQRHLGVRLMEAVGFDCARGRLDVSHHPFCGGVAGDVRITTRYDESDFSKSLMGVLHEAGHGKYEQGLPIRWALQPAGLARGMAMHESQSLFQEMQVARGLPFMRFVAPHLAAEFGADQSEAFTPENLFKVGTRVQRDLIRVDADEVTYPAHIILRYEIEKELISGALCVADIPDAWDARMQSLLGLSTAGNFKDGCMQDVHWAAGLFGYFPSYTLGALIAAQLFVGACGDIADLDGHIARGDFRALDDWLQARVWSRGSLATTAEIVREATGQPLATVAFENHLRSRYLGQSWNAGQGPRS